MNDADAIRVHVLSPLVRERDELLEENERLRQERDNAIWEAEILRTMVHLRERETHTSRRQRG